MTENALVSSNYVDWGNTPIKNRPEAITYPRRCYCGYPLKPGEFAFYFIARWTCPHCIKEEDKRLSFEKKEAQ